MAKDKDYKRMIHTVEWLRLRKAKLSANPLCERCKAEGRITPATEVHHVVPVEDGLSANDKRRLMFDYHNLRSLCHACHVLTHTEMGRSGRPHAKRVQEERARQFASQFLAKGGNVKKCPPHATGGDTS